MDSGSHVCTASTSRSELSLQPTFGFLNTICSIPEPVTLLLCVLLPTMNDARTHCCGMGGALGFFDQNREFPKEEMWSRDLEHSLPHASLCLTLHSVPSRDCAPVSPFQGIFARQKSSPPCEETSVGPRFSELPDTGMHLFTANVRDCAGLFLTMAIG